MLRGAVWLDGRSWFDRRYAEGVPPADVVRPAVCRYISIFLCPLIFQITCAEALMQVRPAAPLHRATAVNFADLVLEAWLP